MDEIRQEALGFVNEIRERLDLSPLDKLIPGVCKDSARCVLAESIIFSSDLDIEVSPMSAGFDGYSFVYISSNHRNDFVGFEGYDNGTKVNALDGYDDEEPDQVAVSITEDSVLFGLPDRINKFAIDFDEHKYPDLLVSHGRYAHDEVDV